MTMKEQYPWYHIADVNEGLLQGDFVHECPIVVPPPIISSKVQEVDIKNYDVVIMSQSCDLEQGKISLILVCPYYSLAETRFSNNNKDKEKLRKGSFFGYHLLKKCELEGFETDFLVVDFRNVYSVDFDFLVSLVRSKGRRLRLLPPYREHLSQAFARFFMRVGLPVDIPVFV